MEIRHTLDIDFSITQELGLLEGSSSSYKGPTFSPQPLNLSKCQSKNGKAEEKLQTVDPIKQMLQQNTINCEDLLLGEKGSALLNYSDDQRRKLECHYLEIISVIERSLPTTLINSCHLVLDSLSEPMNRVCVMNFNILLDQKLKIKILQPVNF